MMPRDAGGLAMVLIDVPNGFWRVAEVAVQGGWGATWRLLALMAGLLVFMLVLGIAAYLLA